MLLCRTKTELKSSYLVLCGASGLADLPSVACRVENTEKSDLGCLIKFVPHRSKVVFPSVSSPQAFCPAKEVKPVQNYNKYLLIVSPAQACCFVEAVFARKFSRATFGK